MNNEVRSRWLAFSAPLEGRVYCMYLDVKGLVTTGVGNLIDPVSYALMLPWQKPDGQHASADEIAAEWRAVKADASLAQRGYHAAEKATKLRLSGAAVDALVMAKLEENDKVFASEFPAWASFPWQAQMAIHSMGWAMGPRFGYPAFRAACKAGNWLSAKAECTISEAGNPGIIARNKANRELLAAAASGQQAPLPSAPALPPAAAPSPTHGRWDWLEAFVAWLLRKKA